MAKDRSQYITGGSLAVMGVFGLLGSITGNLAKMLAALWDPSDLTGFTPSTANSVLNTALGGTNVFSDIINFFKIGA